MFIFYYCNSILHFFQAAKYSTKSANPAVLRGKISLLNKGMLFSKLQVQDAMLKFCKCGNDTILEVDNHTCTGPEFDDGDDVEVEDNDDVDVEVDDVVEEDQGDEETEPILPSASTIQGKQCGGLDSVYTWEFPISISQSTFPQGRNGSNACSVIALVLAHKVTMLNVQLNKSSRLDPEWTELVCQSIVSGNRLYDSYRNSLPNRYLSAAEAAMVVSYEVDVEQPLPIRVCDPHEATTLKYQLYSLCQDAAKGTICSALFIVNEKTSLFVAMGSAIVHIDTHCHGHCGTIVNLGSEGNLTDFITTIQKVIALQDDTYGNFCTVNF